MLSRSAPRAVKPPPGGGALTVVHVVCGNVATSGQSQDAREAVCDPINAGACKKTWAAAARLAGCKGDPCEHATDNLS